MQRHNKRVFIHIGLPKTGTTTFQEMLRENAVALQEFGLATMTDGAALGDFSRQSGRIARYGRMDLTARWRMKRAARRLAEEVMAQPADTVLVSHENLPGWRTDNLYRVPYAQAAKIALDELRAALAECDVHWILGLRDSEAHLRSSYTFLSQRKGVCAPFDSWARANGSEKLEKLIEDAVVDLGKNAYVFRMEDEVASGKPWGHNILEYIGIPPEQRAQLKDVSARNQSVPKDLLPYVHKVNAMRLPKKIRHEIIEVLKDVRNEHASRPKHEDSPRHSGGRP